MMATIAKPLTDEEIGSLASYLQGLHPRSDEALAGTAAPAAPAAAPAPTAPAPAPVIPAPAEPAPATPDAAATATPAEA
jgi:hypothetical protein